MAATPGFEEGGHEYYTLAGAERLRDALAEFEGGRVLVSVLGAPFKCPPAPFEGSFLLHEHFTLQGIRDEVQMATTFPMQRPVPVTGEVSQMFRDALASRGVEEHPAAARHQHRPGGPRGASEERRDDALRPVRRDPRPPGTRPARGRGARGRRMGARRPDQPQDAIPQRLRTRGRQHRPEDGPEGGDLRRVGRAGRGRRHRGGDLRRGAARAVRGVGHLLRRVRRRARQQGGGQLPAAARPRWPRATSLRSRSPRRRRSSARRAVRAGSDAERTHPPVSMYRSRPSTPRTKVAAACSDPSR